MRPISLRTSLTLSYAGVLVLFLAVLGLIYAQAFSRQLDRDAAAELAEITRGIHGYLRFEHGTPRLAYDPHDGAEVAFIEDAARYFQVYDGGSGRLLLQSPLIEPLRLHYTPEQVRALIRRPTSVTVVTDRGRIRLSNSVVSPAGDERYLVQVGVPLDSRDAAVGRFRTLLIWSLPACVVAVVGIGRWMAGRALAPLARLARDAQTIDVNGLHRRLPTLGVGDELDAVAEAFNDVVARLARAVAEMRQFSAAMAHEIRTPLAAIRADMELSLTQMQPGDERRPAITSQIEEIDKLTRLLGQLLTLARAEAGELGVAHDRVSLDAVCRSVVDTLEPVAYARDISLTYQGAPGLTIVGDHGWIERLLINLVDNAIKFTPAGGTIGVALQRVGSRVVLSVQDSGVGIVPDAVPHVFERFYRADTARSSVQDGAGLGLALSKWIVERHRGRIAVASEVGRGTRFSVTLPLAAAA